MSENATSERQVIVSNLKVSAGGMGNRKGARGWVAHISNKRVFF